MERVTGYRCEAAASGTDAVNIMLSIAARGVPTFDAVMIDYAMTHHSTLKEVRHLALPRSIPLRIRQCCSTSRLHDVVHPPTSPLTFLSTPSVTAGETESESRWPRYSSSPSLLWLHRPYHRHVRLNWRRVWGVENGFQCKTPFTLHVKNQTHNMSCTLTQVCFYFFAVMRCRSEEVWF